MLEQNLHDAEDTTLSGRISVVFRCLYFNLENKPSVNDDTRKILLA